MAHVQPRQYGSPSSIVSGMGAQVRRLRKRIYSQLLGVGVALERQFNSISDTTSFNIVFNTKTSLHKLIRRHRILITITILLTLIIFSKSRRNVMRNKNRDSSNTNTGNGVSSQLSMSSKIKLARIKNEDIVHRIPHVVKQMTNITHSSDGLFAQGQFDSGTPVLFVFKQSEIPAPVLSKLPGQPSLRALATELKLGYVIALSLEFRMELSLVHSFMKRRDTRSLYRALGFKTASHIPRGYSINVVAYPSDHSTGAQPNFYTTLHTPAIEPYEWRARLPTISNCTQKKANIRLEKLDKVCQAVTDGLMVLAVAGCALPSTLDVLADTESSTDKGHDISLEEPALVDETTDSFRFGLPDYCFDSSTESFKVTTDVWKAFVVAVCPDLAEIASRLHALVDVQWGVAHRAASMALWVETNPSLRKACPITRKDD